MGCADRHSGSRCLGLCYGLESGVHRLRDIPLVLWGCSLAWIELVLRREIIKASQFMVGNGVNHRVRHSETNMSAKNWL